MSGVKILALFERLMEIHSNSPKLYYGFKKGLSRDVGGIYTHRLCAVELI